MFRCEVENIRGGLLTLSTGERSIQKSFVRKGMSLAHPGHGGALDVVAGRIHQLRVLRARVHHRLQTRGLVL